MIIFKRGAGLAQSGRSPTASYLGEGLVVSIDLKQNVAEFYFCDISKSNYSSIRI